MDGTTLRRLSFCALLAIALMTGPLTGPMTGFAQGCGSSPPPAPPPPPPLPGEIDPGDIGIIDPHDGLKCMWFGLPICFEPPE